MSPNAWIAGFRSGVISPDEQIKLAESRAFTDQTVRQVLRLAGGGAQLRIRLTNRYGKTPLVIDAARVAMRKTGSEIVAETDTALRFDDAERVVVPPGGEVVSDPVEFTASAGAELALSLYLPGPTGLATFSQEPGEIAYVAAGNVASDAVLATAEEVPARFYVVGVDVLAPAGTPVAVAFGDSWFEGAGTTVGANRRSVDFLDARLDRGWVVNQGISGNRLLTREIGDPGLERFDRDALTVPGVTSVLVNFGINDLILGGLADQPPATADELIAGFNALAHRAHAAGLTIHAATIGPFAGCIYEGVTVAETLPTRRRVNEWLRRSDVFDSVFDVARAVEDPERADFIRPGFDSGDGMHLNDAGARAMAESVDVAALFG
ncbi:GDSL-type esterase/lipase family protein [Nocardia sp. NBC_00508]|uniref:GDSL-type esterase/lipase family protein n=1 Tax=Nocardia sp. NBC_00508 TaxID=2975992 RepID=UPI002E808025|nr:GDSL-type esterase/lipase family protein [Nocardia sp. NBC_00508]WUD63966.1 GDSL-type esterase/lipase family protein [Nocardia sp. NBC_00508]